MKMNVQREDDLKAAAKHAIVHAAVRFVKAGGREGTPEQEQTIHRLREQVGHVFAQGHVAIEFKAACHRLRVAMGIDAE